MAPTNIADGLNVSNFEDAERFGSEFAYVVTLSRDAVGVDHAVHCPIRDGMNEQIVFDNAVRVVSDRHDDAGDVLVHCEAGVSRSPCVAATVIADDRGITFDEALSIVRHERPQTTVHPELIDQARTFLGQTGRYSGDRR